MTRKNPFQGPQWRYLRVLRLLDSRESGKRASRRDDAWVTRARRYYLQKQTATTDAALMRLEDEFFDIHVARQIYLDVQGVSLRTMTEARILSGQPIGMVADAIGSEPEAVEAYVSLFFDVQNRLPNSDWVVRHVFGPSGQAVHYLPHESVAPPTEGYMTLTDPETPQLPTFVDPSPRAVLSEILRNKGRKAPPESIVSPVADASLKLFAYYGGPHVCNFMITGMVRDVESFVGGDGSEIVPWLQKQFQTMVHRRALETMSRCKVTQFDLETLLNLNVRLIELDKSVAGTGVSGSASKASQGMQRALRHFFSRLPVAHGKRAQSLYLGSRIGSYDDGPIELRASELQSAALLEADATLPERDFAFPQNRPTES